MATKKRYRRSRKTTPLQEIGFVAILFAVVATLSLRQNMDDPNLGLIMSFFFLIALILGGCMYLWLLYKQRMKREALRALKIAQVDDMNGEEFEEYVAELMRFQGYKTRMTPRSGDFGVDIVASKDGIKIAVQVKRYSSKLGLKPIQEVVGGRMIRQYSCTKIMVVTNSTFTDNANLLASEGGCKLVDREKLAEWILAFQGNVIVKESQQRI